MILGSGILGWHSGERHTDRYGTVHLNYGTHQQAAFMDAPVGSAGTLSAKVIEIIRPGSELDKKYGMSPIPEGEAVLLGEGLLFRDNYGPHGNLVCIGVQPDDGRTENWMDRNALYRLAGQRVELIFLKDTFGETLGDGFGDALGL